MSVQIASTPRGEALSLRGDASRPVWRALRAAEGISKADQARLDAITDQRRAVARGDTLFRAGDALAWLHEVHSGIFKTSLASADGRVQVTGFHMKGDLLGLDGLDSGRHAFDAVALEPSVVCAVPYEALKDLLRDAAGLQHEFHRVLSREIVRDQAMMMMLGSLRADERVALFLLDMLRRQRDSGLPTSPLGLRMSRDDIGSYLGLTLETVSRTFSRFANEGVLAVKNRQLEVLDEAALRRMARCPG